MNEKNIKVGFEYDGSPENRKFLYKGMSEHLKHIICDLPFEDIVYKFSVTENGEIVVFATNSKRFKVLDLEKEK